MIYTYHLLPLQVVVDYFRLPLHETPDAYLSDDLPTRQLARLLANGYRWIRTDNELAIFEKQLSESPKTPIKINKE